MKLGGLCREGEERLRKAGIEEAALDSRLLLCEAYGLSTAEYLVKITEEAEEDARYESYLRMLSERERRRPLQYILGYTEFMGLRMGIDENVLIPRQDTETLCELVLGDEGLQGALVLDLCTGSGAIALALSALGDFRIVIGTDISRGAIARAEQNREEVVSQTGKELPVFFHVSDLFSSLRKIMKEHGIESFDVIVSNPPYIRPEVIAGLEPEVRDHEPLSALDGGEDGLWFYRRIAEEAPLYLARPGRIYLEIGYDQGDEVRSILKKAGFTDIDIHEDLGGRPRVVTARIR